VPPAALSDARILNKMAGKYKGLHMVAFTLLVIGGLNWLIFALFKTDIGINGLGYLRPETALPLMALFSLGALITYIARGLKEKIE